jgi:hypothetical protein
VIELKIIILIKLMNATEMNQSSININLLWIDWNQYIWCLQCAEWW